MKRMRIVGLCILAVCALGAWAASSASALPEVIRCQSSETGKYKNAACTEKAVASEKGNKAKFEIHKGLGGTLEGFTSAGGEGKLEGASGTEIKCTSQSATGKYDEDTGKITEVENVKATFTGCSLPLFGVPCETKGAAAGEITTTSLHGAFKYTSGKGTKTPVVNTGLKPDIAKKGFALFECPAVGVEVYVGEGKEKGHETILANVGPVRVMSSTATQVYEGAKGVQNPQHIEGSAVIDNLESSLSGPKGTFERSDQVLTTVLTGEQEAEILA